MATKFVFELVNEYNPLIKVSPRNMRQLRQMMFSFEEMVNTTIPEVRVHLGGFVMGSFDEEFPSLCMNDGKYYLFIGECLKSGGVKVPENGLRVDSETRGDIRVFYVDAVVREQTHGFIRGKNRAVVTQVK